ncbi:fructose-specific PTS transporter subunit EIIC [Microbacterium sp. EYE_5]|uniref:PTS fructose transporter subunit IIABC n=1 Tax=unclassified Microbacterium TaxID=2609290 RepID=UPI0020061438|nr:MULTISPECIES: fructose-specific PTS transporter subunit EIIC [unclassified Microbacterium]MCK6080902.1 fructose-specific PTS transporter subunit EIIC [Microbacterium sp. EYE_382]MCK6086173.1 fructose-specific PTS transporter subunit EIIC [Microbacterium sp. EYE_384]MCK6124329.1 fructose-specific PTS transporter subunit EIIC [Microbacterium sp. EYE_80]MCK6127238.1 fructose-specific PTS transporter subunit EIIC [Microbacterium sp. EYE_79]MCK6141857.1 fructose-specific PTS transporter subunit 
MTEIITAELVSIDEPLGGDKRAVIDALAQRVAAQGRASDGARLAADAWAREEKDETGLPGGIAIPHAKSAAVSQASLAFARLNPGVDFGAEDGGADLVFLIAAPDTAAEEHLAVLSKLARSLMRDDFTAGLRAASSADEVVAIVRDAISDAPPAASTAAAPHAAPATDDAVTIDGRPARIVAVTACATGIAHTFMAADALSATGQKEGVDLVVEPQGSSGYKAIDQKIIDDADAVIFAVDVDVREQARFAGKPVVRSGVKRGIEQPAQLIAEAIAAAKNPNAARVSGAASSSTSSAAAPTSFGGTVKRALLTGVSYMIPFVAGGGLLIALGFALAGYEIASGHPDSNVNNAVYALQNFTLWNLPPEGLLYYLGAVAFQIGGLSFGFLVPALAGYIAYGIADRPGIAPGFVAGAVATFMGAGFIGAIVGGLLAGLAAWWLNRLEVPRWLRGLMPVVIIPLLGSIFASGLMLMVFGGPIAALTVVLNDWLAGLTGAGVVLLGVILGLMMCFDLGGPVNKVAYGFATANLAAGIAGDERYLQIMAAVMAAGMVPPLAMALASTVLGRRLFTAPERENGKAAWLLGAAFISEGAIPFAAADVFRVIPAAMLGGAVTGALSMFFAVTSRAPHGGVFVFFAIDNFWLWLLSIAVGTVISAVAVVLLKRFARRRPVDADVPAAAVTA